LSERNKTFALLIFTPTPLAWLLLALHLALLSIEGAVLALVRRDYRIFREIYAGVFASLMRERGRLLKIRTALQKSRVATTVGFLSCFTMFPSKLAMLFRHGVPDIR
jgi:hypothetical protein